MNHAKTRDAAIKGMDLILSRSRICGPPNNLDFLDAIMRDDTFKAGNTITSFLKTFEYAPGAIDVISGGAYTLVEGELVKTFDANHKSNELTLQYRFTRQTLRWQRHTA